MVTLGPDCAAAPLDNRSARFCVAVLVELKPWNIDRLNWITSLAPPPAKSPVIELWPKPDAYSKVSGLSPVAETASVAWALRENVSVPVVTLSCPDDDETVRPLAKSSRSPEP